MRALLAAACLTSCCAHAEERRIEGHSLEGLVNDGWTVIEAQHFRPSDELISQNVPGWSQYVFGKDGRILDCVWTIEWVPPEFGPGREAFTCVER